MIITFFFNFTDWINTLWYLLNHFLILLASVSHQTCFNLTTSENTSITISFVLIKICQCRNSFSCSKFWTFNNLFIWNSIRNNKFWWISWWNVKIIVFNKFEYFFSFIFFINNDEFLDSLPSEFISYVIKFPAIYYWFFKLCLFSELKSMKSIYSCYMSKFRYFLLKLF